MTTVDPRRFTRPPIWHKARVELASVEAHRDACRRHVEDLDGALQQHEAEAARHREEIRRAGRDLPILTPEEANRVSAGDALIEYHPAPNPQRIAAAAEALAAAEGDVMEARAALAALADETWDPVAEARKAGARYIVTTTCLPMGEVVLYSGSPVPPELLDALPWQKVDNFKRSRIIAEV